VLVLWEEVDLKAVQQPLFEDCYTDLRDVLIDRSGEIEEALSNPGKVAKGKEKKVSGKRQTKIAS